MKDPRTYVERFCYNHPNFGIRGLMKYICIANVAIWLFQAVNPTILLYLDFSPYYILHGQVWRLVSFILYPPDTGIIAFLAFYFYYWVGSTLEQHWGTAQFNIFFFSGALLTIIYGFLMYFIFGINLSITAFYLYFSMFFSFAIMFPDVEMLLLFIIPIKIKYLAYADAALFIYGIFTTSFPVNMMPVVAFLNVLIFFGGDLLRSIRGHKTTANAVNFRRESRRIRKEQESKLYNHKCSVCGRTDTDYPQLQFRYCSRCAGYHCFCEDHINNHIHFTE